LQSVPQQSALNQFINDFPPTLRPYISSVKDVPADGNCGFWAIAGLVNILQEDAAVQVRKDLINELYSNLAYYQQMWSAAHIEEMTESLSFFESCPGKAYWMQMPDMGPLIASTYGVALFHLSKHQCITYLPHRTPPPTNSRKDIAIAFVNGNHFVQVRIRL
jgi:hypothetical protein